MDKKPDTTVYLPAAITHACTHTHMHAHTHMYVHQFTRMGSTLGDVNETNTQGQGGLVKSLNALKYIIIMQTALKYMK